MSVDKSLDLKLSELDIEEKPENKNEPVRRSTRIKGDPAASKKKRVKSKPKKLSHNTIDAIKHYYLDKKIKRSPSTLETIFEIPKSDKFMSKRKFSRVITNAVKKRSMKAKKIKHKKLTMELLMKKLSRIGENI